MRRWPSRIRSAGGSRTHLKPLCRRLPCRLAPAPSCQCPRQESNLILDLRRVACDPQHSEDVFLFSALPRNRTSSGSFEDCHALPAHPQGLLSKRLDQDSNLDQDLRRVLCDPLHHRDIQYPDLESNLDQGLGVPCAIRYTIGMYQPEPTTGVAPASSGLQNRRLAVRPRRRAGARGFEPRTAALEAASSPRRTLLYRPSVPKNRGPLA